MSVVSLVAWGIVFLLFVNGFFQLLKYISEKRSLHNTYEKLTLLAKERQTNEESLMKNEGNREKVDFLTRLDILILQSGIKRKMPFLTAEIYIGFDVLLGVICLAVAWKATGVLLFALIGSATGMVSTYLLMQIMRGNKAKAIEEDMNVFLDLIATYSKSSDDLVDILGKVYPSLHEPLSTYVEEFYFEAINVDTATAFLHLNYKIPHEKLKEILGNLETCSKNLTDYSNIAKKSQEQMMVYLEGKREREDARKNGFMELMVFCGFGIIAFIMLGVFAGTNIFQFLVGNVIGQCIMLYFGIIILYGLVLTFSSDKG